MYNSILHFIKDDIKEIEIFVAAMLKGEKQPLDLSQNIHDRVLGLGGRLKDIRGSRSEPQQASWKRRYRPVPGGREESSRMIIVQDGMIL